MDETMTKFDNFISLFQKKTTESSIRYDYDLEHAVFQGKVCAFTGHRPEKMPFDGEKDPSCLLRFMQRCRPFLSPPVG